jgi:hypothetical protein
VVSTRKLHDLLKNLCNVSAFAVQAFLGVLNQYEVTAGNLPDLLSLACSYSSMETLALLVDLGAQLPQMKHLAGKAVTEGPASYRNLRPDKAAWGDCLAELLESCLTQQKALKFETLLLLPACNAMGELGADCWGYSGSDHQTIVGSCKLQPIPSLLQCILGAAPP